MNTRRLTLLAALIIVFRAFALGQSVPPLINYQGQLSDAAGQPLPTADYKLTFSIFNAASGGDRVWGPQVFDGIAATGHGPRIPVVQGFFNVMLGPMDEMGRSLAENFGESNRYIEVQVGEDAPITPRQRFVSAAFAFRANESANSSKLAGADWSALFGTNDPVAGKFPGSRIVPGTITTNEIAKAIIDMLIPPGTVIAFAGTVVPNGWELCDGAPLSGTDPKYVRLYQAIGTTHGGNGTVFNKPDLRGRTVAGRDNMGGLPAGRISAAGIGSSGIDGTKLGAAGGTDRHTLDNMEMPIHNHPVEDPGHTHAAWAGGGGGRGWVLRAESWGGGWINVDNWGVQHARTGISLIPAGGSHPHPVVQPTMILNYIIKL